MSNPLKSFDSGRRYIIAGVLVLLVACGFAFWVFSSTSEKDEGEKKDESSQVVEEVRNTERPSGNVASHQKELLDLADELLVQAVLIDGTQGSDSLYSDLTAGKLDNLPETFRDRFRFDSVFAEDKKLQGAGYLAVLQVGKIINTTFPKDQTVGPLFEGVEKNIYVDMEAGNAYVPLGLFLGSQSSFSLGFVWVDGEWVFVPYSLLDSISAVDNALNQEL